MSLSIQTKTLQDFIRKNSDFRLLSESDLAVVYQDLVDCLIDHNHMYYIENSPIISDVEYDELFSYLKKIEDNFPNLISGNSPTQMLIGQSIIQDGFEKAEHKVKLISLENSYDAEDLKAFDERLKKILVKENIEIYSYTLEPKYDGISVELVYQDGKFKQAITRGDGQVGEDITENVKTIKSIPKKLKHKSTGMVSVRGEILMAKSQLEKLNQEREKNGQAIFANTRNACAGSVKLLDSKEVEKRGLDCFVYDLLYTTDKSLEFTSHGEILEYLKNQGLPIFQRLKQCTTIDEIVSYCDEKTRTEFNNQDYDFDGLVVKINELKFREILGSTEHHPRWAIAYKFPAHQVATKIVSVDRQVGRTGVLTPVANLEPVQLSGVTISRVSLHNFDFIKNKDIRPDDYVRIQRSGEVIPYVVGVIKDRRVAENTPLTLAPEKCPVCGSEVVNVDIHYYCPNLSCPAQIKEKIIHFVSKDCMDVDGIGESIVELLVDQGILSDYADLYKLLDINTQFLVRAMPGFGDKKIAEIVKGLEASKSKPLRRLINALGIPQIGKKNAQLLVKSMLEKNTGEDAFDYLIKFLSDEEGLNAIYGFGEKTAVGVGQFVLTNKDLLEKLYKLGLNFDVSKFDRNIESENLALAGIHFSITGTFPLTREKIVEEMENQGATFDDTPTKKTTMMLIGENPGSKKEKAENYGVKIIQGRENILKEFDFLKNIKSDSKNTVKAESLF